MDRFQLGNKVETQAGLHLYHTVCCKCSYLYWPVTVCL